MMQARKTLAKLTFVATCAGLTFGAGGCLSLVGADQGAVTITRAALPQRIDGQQCDGTDLQQAIANGVLDLQAGSGYTAALVLRTNLPATFTTQDIQQDTQRSPNYPTYGPTDSNVVSINRAYVYLEDGEASQAPFNPLNPTANQNAGAIAGVPSQTVPRVSNASGVVFNQQTNLGNESAIFVQAITPQEAASLEAGAIGAALVDQNDRKLVIVRMTLEGVTSGAGYVRSNEFSYPITLCRGCLVGGVNCGNNQVLRGQNCALLGQDLNAECVDVNAP